MDTNTHIFSKPKYSNALETCFFDAECIRKREEAEAKALEAALEQQKLLAGIVSQKSGGLKTGAIVGIIIALISISVATVYFIKKRNKK